MVMPVWQIAFAPSLGVLLGCCILIFEEFVIFCKAYSVMDTL